MLRVRLHRIEPDGRHAHKSLGFEDLGALARYFATEEGTRWDWADAPEAGTAVKFRPYSAEALRRMAANESAPASREGRGCPNS
jgi:hypothetical protein